VENRAANGTFLPLRGLTMYAVVWGGSGAHGGGEVERRHSPPVVGEGTVKNTCAASWRSWTCMRPGEDYRRVLAVIAFLEADQVGVRSSVSAGSIRRLA
jgi:hypothetical protein